MSISILTKKIWPVLRLLIFIGFILLFVFYFLEHRQDFYKILDLPLMTIISILCLQFAIIVTNIIFFKLFLRHFKSRIDTINAYQVIVKSSLINFFGFLQGGTGYRAYYAKKHFGISYKKFSVIFGINSAVVLLIASVLGLLGLLVYGITNSTSTVFTGILLSGIALGILFIMFKPAMLFISGFKLFRAFKNIAIEWNNIIANKKFLSVLFTVGLFQFCVMLLLYYFQLSSLGYSPSFSGLLLYTAIANLSLIVAITPSAIGIRESLLISAQGALGISTNAIILAGTIDRISYFVLLLCMALSVLVISFLSKRGKGKSESNLKATERPIQKVLFTTSTIPASETDLVPGFVRDEAIWMKKLYPSLDITVLAPHSAHSKTKKFVKHAFYDEYRFHYFWPFRFELLTGKGIQPALKKNKLLYFELPGLFLAEFIATFIHVVRHKPDLIYAHWFTPQAITSALAAKLTHTPFVFDTQASDAIVLKRLPFANRIVVSICRQALAYTVPSQQTLDKLLYFTNNENRDEILNKAVMVPYGTSPVNVRASDVNFVKEKYKLKNKDVIYFIGRLVDRKGVDILIKAFSQVPNEDDSKRLVIVGDGQYRSELEKLTARLGLTHSVIFTGFIVGIERYALLDCASVCVIPSVNVGDQSEGLPVVFMEGLLSNKVMVISDETGAHEVVENGKNAFVVKAGSVEDLTIGIKNGLAVASKKNPAFYDSVGALAKTFDWTNVAKRRAKALKIVP